MKRVNVVLVGVALVALQGCFSHTPVGIEHAPAGAKVRARVSPNEAVRLGELLGREDRILGGTVMSVDSDGLLLQLPVAGVRGSQRLQQRIQLAPGEIERLELRTLDRRRTAGLVAGIAAAGGLLAYQQFGSGAQDASRPDPPPVNEIRIPIVGWRW